MIGRKISLTLATLLILTMILPIIAINAGAEDINLAKGKDYTIQLDAETENAFPKLAVNDPDKILTDGVKAPSSVNYSDSRYLRLYRGVYTSVVIDLGETSYVNGFSAGFYGHTGNGVHLPREVYFSVSEDGENWFTVFSEIDNTIQISTARTRKEIKRTGTDHYAARYVRIKISTDVFSYCDEIEVFGTKSDVSTVKYVPDTPVVYPEAFCNGQGTPIEGINNIVLIYNGAFYAGTGADLGFNTYEELKPYAAYINEDKQVADTMFTSFLFLPLNPGTDAPYSLSMQSGWEMYLENTIGKNDDINFTALDKVVGDVKTELSLESDVKYDVFITIPYQGFTGSSFWGNTTNSLTGSTAAIRKYVDLAISAFNDAAFANLSLAGFYWYNETVSFTSDSYQKELICNINDYIHSLDFGSIWIPYYCSPGANMWKELGFDCAALQTGYAFPKDDSSETGSPLEGTCFDSMTYGKKIGMGVEIEISSADLSRYNDYISNAVRLGCMSNGISMFYQEGGPGVFYNAQKNTATRKYYDMTYQYIKNNYEKNPPRLDFDEVILVEKNFARTNGTLPITDADTNRTKLKINSIVEPTHGSVSLDGQGFFVYVPNDDYIGTDSFSFTVTDGFNISESFTVNLSVVEKVFRFNSQNSTLYEDKAVIFSDVEKADTEPSDGYRVFELSVDAAGKVTSASYTTGSTVPENGYVVSASGTKAEELEKACKIGDFVQIDAITRSMYFYSDEQEVSAPEVSTEQSRVSETESSKAVEDDGSSSKTALLIAIGAVALIAIGITAFVINKKQKNTKKE